MKWRFVRPRADTPPVELLKVETPDFIPPKLWSPNSPDLNPVDYKIWGLLQKRVYKTSTKDVDELRCQIAEEWDKLDQRIIDKAFAEWRKRLRACVAAIGGQFEQKCEHLSFLIFCIRILWPNALKLLLFCSVKLVVLLSTMRVICYIL